MVVPKQCPCFCWSYYLTRHKVSQKSFLHPPNCPPAPTKGSRCPNFKRHRLKRACFKLHGMESHTLVGRFFSRPEVFRLACLRAATTRGHVAVVCSLQPRREVPAGRTAVYDPGRWRPGLRQGDAHTAAVAAGACLCAHGRVPSTSLRPRVCAAQPQSMQSPRWQRRASCRRRASVPAYPHSRQQTHWLSVFLNWSHFRGGQAV